MLAAIFQYGFMRNAFAAAILASIACGIMGTIIVEKKLVMMSGGIAHASFGGIGLGYLTGIEPIHTALLFSAGASVGIASLKEKLHGKRCARGDFMVGGDGPGALFS